MKRAMVTLGALAAFSLAACGDPEPADGGAAAPGQARPVPGADAGLGAGAVSAGSAADTAAEDSMPPTGGYGEGRQTRYRDCMAQARQAGPPLQQQIEEACARLPDAPK